MKVKLLTLLAIFMLGSCENNEVNTEPISVTIINQALNIKNHSKTDLYFTVFAESWLPLIDWAPFISEENRLFPSDLVKIPLDEETDFFGKIPGNEPLVIYYWEAIEEDGKLVPGTISQFTFN